MPIWVNRLTQLSNNIHIVSNNILLRVDINCNNAKNEQGDIIIQTIFDTREAIDTIEIELPQEFLSTDISL